MLKLSSFELPCRILSVCILTAIAIQAQGASGASTPRRGPLKTKWAAEVTPEKALPEYPRPQLARKQWLNLKGLWDLAIAPKDMPRPDAFDQRILVPFPVES